MAISNRLFGQIGREIGQPNRALIAALYSVLKFYLLLELINSYFYDKIINSAEW